MRIAFAGTPLFAAIHLQALLDKGFDVKVVYTQPDKPAGRHRHLTASPVKELALQYQLPVEQPVTLKSTEAAQTLANYNVDVMIVAAYGLLLPKQILNTPRYGCINLHASLLPRWRGASPIQHAILSGDNQTGITLMKMDEGLDTGDMLATIVYDIKPDDTAETLHNKLAALGATLLIEKLPILVSLVPTPQNPALATHAPKIKKEEAQCDWNKPALVLEREIRAYNPWPISYTHIDEHILRLWKARAVSLSEKAPVGTIASHTKEGITVMTGEGGLLIMEAQLPNKRAMTISEIVNSQHDLFAIGKRFQ